MLIPPEAFVLPPPEQGSLQQRIRQMVTEGVLSGRFRPGQKLPSTRGLAGHLQVSRITVTLAYAELVAQDYLSWRGAGRAISSRKTRRWRPTRRRLRHGPRRRSSRFAPGGSAGIAGSTGRRTGSCIPFRFIYGQPDESLFDHQNWRLCAVRALGKRDFAAMTADLYEGDDPLLVEQILRRILPRRGIAAREDEVLVTMGAQNALYLAAQCLLGPGRSAVMENPGYPGLRGILRGSGAAVRSVDVDEAGLPPEAIPKAADVVFTTASHQGPTNATMPVERRRALLEAAEREGFLLVEDDYEFEMSFLKPASPALKSLDGGGRVVYVGSFSKSVFPGMRLGYLVGPPGFIREARALRLMSLRHPPGHIQRTMAYFLALGHYDTLIHRMRAAFKRRRQAMEEAIAAEGLTMAGQGGFGGSSFWMRAPVETEGLAERLRAEGVVIEPGRAFFDPARPDPFHYRLGYGSIAQAKIPEGIARIAGAIARSG